MKMRSPGLISANLIAIARRANVKTLLMLLELGNVTTYRFPPQGQAKFLLKKLAEHADIAAFLRNHSEPVRAQIDSNDVHYNPASLTTNVYKVFTGIREQMMYSTNFLHRQAAEPPRP